MRNKPFSLITLVLLLAAMAAFSQENPLAPLVEKYRQAKGFYFADLKTNLIKNDSLDEGFSGTVDLKLLSMDHSNSAGLSAGDLYAEFNRTVQPEKFRGLVTVRHNQELVDLLSREENGMINSVILVLREKGSMTIISVAADFDLKKMCQVEKMKKCKGLDILSQICRE